MTARRNAFAEDGSPARGGTDPDPSINPAPENDR